MRRAVDQMLTLVRPLGVLSPSGKNPFDLRRRTLKPLIGALNPDLVVSVSRYLRNGVLVLPITEYVKDVVKGRFSVAGGSGLMTDGVFYWRVDAAEYVEQYGIAVDLAATEYMRVMDWKVSALSEESFSGIREYLIDILGGRLI